MYHNLSRAKSLFLIYPKYLDRTDLENKWTKQSSLIRVLTSMGALPLISIFTLIKLFNYQKTVDNSFISKVSKKVTSKLYHTKTPKTKRAISVELDDVAHYEPHHQDLRCLQIHLFSSMVLKELI